jgi:hypothetical protein
MSWQNSVCMGVGTPVIGDIQSFVIEEIPKSGSPIDDFYGATIEILTKLDADFFDKYGDEITSSIFIGLISATENYFRDLLGYILATCPSSQAHSADEKIQLGSLLWAGSLIHNRSAFEFMAFSSGDNISKTIAKFTNYQVKKDHTWDKMLKEYDKLCELRHAIVHSGNVVAGKNALKLGLRKTTNILRVKITYAILQEAGTVCTRLVQAANNDMYEVMVRRWSDEWRSSPSWDPDLEKNSFINLKEMFTSKRDRSNGSIINKMSNEDLYLAARAAFNL